LRGPKWRAEDSRHACLAISLHGAAYCPFPASPLSRRHVRC
jgi:hypothetical protein